MTVDLDAAIRLLRLMTPLSASLAFVTVAIGLVTSHWLYSEEKMSNPKFNRTGDPELEYLSKFTVSGLWTLCYTNRNLTFNRLSIVIRIKWIFVITAGETERFCFNIDYFPTEEYSPDPNDSTLSIPCKYFIKGNFQMNFFFVIFINWKKNRCRFKIGSIFPYGNCPFGHRRNCLFPWTFCPS